MTKNESGTVVEKQSFSTQMQRRQFLLLAGVGALTATTIGCKKIQDPGPGNPIVNTDNTVDFADTYDVGIYNLLYAMSQLEVAFYEKTKAAFPADFTAVQKDYITDISLHKLAHREFYKSTLASAAIGSLSFDFSSIDFGNVQSVLATAKLFKNAGVAACNYGIVNCRQNYTLVIVSQLASVEARHSAWISNQVVPNSFADLGELNAMGAVAAEGRDVLLNPKQVLDMVSKFISTKLNVINL